MVTMNNDMVENVENLNTTQTTIQVSIEKIKHFFWLILPTIEKILSGIIYYTIKIIKSIMRTIMEQLKSE